MSFKIRAIALDSEPIIRGKHDDKFPTPIDNTEESKTQQHFKDSCDINKIVGNPDASSSPMHVQAAQAKYGDFSDIFDLGGNMQKFRDAEMAFSHLPPEIKKQIGNKPDGFMKWLTDEKNIDQMLKYGMIEKDPRPKPEQHAPQATRNGKLKKTTTVTEESSDE